MVPFKPELRTGLKALISDINTKCTLENGMGFADILSARQIIETYFETFCEDIFSMGLAKTNCQDISPNYL